MKRPIIKIDDWKVLMKGIALEENSKEGIRHKAMPLETVYNLYMYLYDDNFNDNINEAVLEDALKFWKDYFKVED